MKYKIENWLGYAKTQKDLQKFNKFAASQELQKISIREIDYCYCNKYVNNLHDIYLFFSCIGCTFLSLVSIWFALLTAFSFYFVLLPVSLIVLPTYKQLKSKYSEFSSSSVFALM